MLKLKTLNVIRDTQSKNTSEYKSKIKENVTWEPLMAHSSASRRVDSEALVRFKISAVANKIISEEKSLAKKIVRGIITRLI